RSASQQRRVQADEAPREQKRTTSHAPVPPSVHAAPKSQRLIPQRDIASNGGCEARAAPILTSRPRGAGYVPVLRTRSGHNDRHNAGLNAERSARRPEGTSTAEPGGGISRWASPNGAALPSSTRPPTPPPSGRPPPARRQRPCQRSRSRRERAPSATGQRRSSRRL